MKQYLIMFALVPLLVMGNGAGGKQSYLRNFEETGNFAQASISMEAAPTLTTDYLQGVWVNENGFVCEYGAGVFVYWPNCYMNTTTIVADGIEGEWDLRPGKEKVKLEAIDQDTMKVEGVTAYRSTCETAKKYIESVQKKILGDWIMSEAYAYGDISINFTDGKLTITEPGTQEKMTLPYRFDAENNKLLLGDEDDCAAYNLILNGDDLLLVCDYQVVSLYRKDSKAYQESIEKKADLLIGNWLLVTEDMKPVQQWKVTKDKVTYTTTKKGAKSKTISYKWKMKDGNLSLKVNGITYSVMPTYGYMMVLDEKQNDYLLIPADSEEAKSIMETFTTLQKNGKVEKRSYSCKLEDNMFVKAKITLNCKNNVILDDLISIEGSGYSSINWLIAGEFDINIKTKYKKAYVTLQYDPKRMLFDNAKDFIICYDDGEKTVDLKTKVNEKNHTLTAAYHGNGHYQIIDTYAACGGERDPYDQNPNGTWWARYRDTGDILGMIDMNYIKKSKDHFKVSTPKQLASATYCANTINDSITIELTKDIDLSGYQWASLGWSAGRCGQEFQGKFLGNGHTITGLHIVNNDPLGGFIGECRDCEVSKLTIKDGEVSGMGYCGLLVGEAYDSKFVHCNVSGSVRGEYSVGAFVGSSNDCTFGNCKADVMVNGEKSEQVEDDKPKESEEY